MNDDHFDPGLLFEAAAGGALPGDCILSVSRDVYERIAFCMQKLRRKGDETPITYDGLAIWGICGAVRVQLKP